MSSLYYNLLDIFNLIIMIKEMKNLPEGMIPDRDNVVYYDTEKQKFYIIKWEDMGTSDVPIRYYIDNLNTK